MDMRQQSGQGSTAQRYAVARTRVKPAANLAERRQPSRVAQPPQDYLRDTPRDPRTCGQQVDAWSRTLLVSLSDMTPLTPPAVWNRSLSERRSKRGRCRTREFTTCGQRCGLMGTREGDGTGGSVQQRGPCPDLGR